MKTTVSLKNICLACLLCLLAGCYEYPKVDEPETPFVDKTSLDLFTGATEKLAVSPTNHKFSLTSDNPAVATVAADGTVTAVSAGFAVITVASTSDAIAVDVRVRDYVAVDSIHVSSDGVIGSIGSQVQLFATIYPENATETVEWSTGDPGVATVYQSGMVTFRGTGQTNITAKCGELEKSILVGVPKSYEKYTDKSGWSIPGYQDNYDPQIGYNTQEAGGEGGSPQGRAIALIDNDLNTFWHSRWEGVYEGRAPRPQFPYWVIIDFGQELEIRRIVTTRRSGSRNGKNIEYYVSNTLIAGDSPDWGSPIVSGQFSNDANQRVLDLITSSPSVVKAQYLKLQCLDSWNDFHLSIAEVDVYKAVL